jgi:tRNA pseudouridine55 synthase
VTDRSRKSDGGVDGLLIIDKPGGMTSHDVVARVRRTLHMKRVGHAGTLDPMATGVLVIGVGKATRLLGHLALGDKDYVATIRLGASTTTDDAEGDVVSRSDGSWSREALDAAVAGLTGAISQVPPAFSAIKVAGQRAYAKARAGEDVELAARTVTVSGFAVTSVDGNDVEAEITCSSGTYIRSLARDVGVALGVGGHLAALRRTRVGPFGLDRSVGLEAFMASAAPAESVVGMAESVGATFLRRDLSAEEASELGFGRALDPSNAAGVHGAFHDGRVLALIEDRDGKAKPVVVFEARG